MATLTLSCSSASNSSSFKENAQLRITYTASNGTLKITEIEGRRTDGYRSYNASKTSVTVNVGGTSKSIALSHYVDFNTSWTSFGTTDTSWTGLSGTSVSITATMPSSNEAFGGSKFTGNASMSWSKYTIAYNANGGSGAPNSQTKTHGTSLTLSSTKPTKAGYTFKGWALTKADADDGTWYYQAGGTCGKNENLTLYAVWGENKLTINYYSNYATNAFDDALDTVASNKNVKVWTAEVYYDNDYSTYGIANYSNSTGSLYMTRTGHTATGNWGTSTSGGTLVNENTTFATGQAVAKAFGKDLSSGNASINVYAQWKENELTVKYYSNYATYATYKGEELNASASANVLVCTQTFLYDNSYSDGLANVQNKSYLYLTRTGYAPTGYWGTSSNGGTLVNQSTSFSTGQALAQVFGKSLANGDASVNVYAQWQENAYVLSYDSNGGFGEMNPQTIEWGELFSLSNNAFKRAGYKFLGWNAYRNNDNTWYTLGQGWATEDEIVANGYTKKLYENQCELTFDNSWVRENEEARLYTMYAVWKISGVVYMDNGTAFEPYLAYIDNGTSWDLCLVYIDSGTNWDVAS